MYWSSPRSQAAYTTDLGACSSVAISATVKRRSSGMLPTSVPGTKVSVSPASVESVHFAASACTTAVLAGAASVSDSNDLTPVASRCTSSSAPCQGEGRRFEPGVPLHMAPESLRISGPSSLFDGGDAPVGPNLLTQHGTAAVS